MPAARRLPRDADPQRRLRRHARPAPPRPARPRAPSAGARLLGRARRPHRARLARGASAAGAEQLTVKSHHHQGVDAIAGQPHGQRLGDRRRERRGDRVAGRRLRARGPLAPGGGPRGPGHSVAGRDAPRPSAARASPRRILGEGCHGSTDPKGRIAGARPRRGRAVLGRLRQRGLVDLLRARRHRRLRARADAGRLRDRRA